MSLRDKNFERLMRRRMKLVMRERPAVRAEYRRIRHRDRVELGSPSTLRALVTLAFLGSLAKMASHQASVDALLGLLTLWCACFSIYYATRLRYFLYGSPDILVMILQPVSDTDIFARQWRRWGRATFWILLDALGALAVIFSYTGAGMVQCIAAAICAVALWMSAIALAAIFVWRRPAANYGGFASAIFLLLATVVVAGFYKPDVVARVLEGASGPFYALPPFGWVNYVVRQSVLGPERLPLLLLGPVGFLVPALHHALKRIGARYELVASHPDGVEDDEGDNDLLTDSPELPPLHARGTSGAADAEAIAAVAGAWSSIHRDGSEGWIESLIDRWLTPRERNVGEFMTGGQTGWTRALRRAVILVVAALAAALSLGPTGLWICYVGLYLAISTGLPLLGNSCVGFTTVTLAGASFPAYAGLPVGFRETARFLLKVGLVRILAFLPVGLVAGAVLGQVAGIGWLAGFSMAAKVLILIVCSQPIIVGLQFSSGTNDTRGPFWKVAKIATVFGSLIAVVLVASAAFLFAPLPWALLGIAVAASLSWGFFLLYGRFYARNAFDLMYGQPQ